MKRIIQYIVLLACLFACKEKPQQSDQQAQELSKPNFVFIFADDLSYRGVNALGNPQVQTPHLDRLAASGTTFTHAYNMGGWNGAICAASRAMIISGRSLWRANRFREEWKEGQSLDKTWPKLLEQNDYRTYMTGKWHVDAPADKIFQQARHIRPGMPRDLWPSIPKDSLRNRVANDQDWSSLMPAGYNRPLSPQDNSWSPTDSSFGGFWEGGTHWSEVVRDDALAFMDDATTSEDPFFMYLAFNAAHDPRQAPQPYFDLYPIDSIKLPANYRDVYEDQMDIGNGPLLRDEALAPFPRTPYAIKKHLQEYYAIISHMDDQIGAIIAGLEKRGLMENTYICFTADHGLAVGSHGFLGKQNMYDHSMRVPFILSGPTIPKSTTVPQSVHLQDAMPTTLQLAGVPIPDYVEFQSVLPLINSRTVHNPMIYGAYVNIQRMIRNDQFKLIYYPRLDKIKLFNLALDPYEINDISGELSTKNIKRVMWEQLQIMATTLEDPLEDWEVNLD